MVKGTVFLNLTIDSEDYSEYFYGHYLSDFGINISENPGNYLCENLRVGSYSGRLTTYFKENNNSFSLTWPYNYSNDRIVIEKDQTIVKDRIRNAGILKGELEFTGILKTDDLTNLSMSVSGTSGFYGPNGWIPQLTGGGSSSRNWDNIDDPYISYLFFLTEGPWLPYQLSASTSNYDRGYYSKSSMTIYDYNYNYNYDGSTYNFGQPVEIMPGMSVVQNREYCTGSVLIRIRVQGGGLLSNPSFNGTGTHYNEDNKQEMSVSVSGNASVQNHEAPALEVFGPPGDYTLTVSAKLEDGGSITFAAIPVTIECNVRKIKDVAGPDIVIYYPSAELVTNAEAITLRGKASDDSGIEKITVNDVVTPQIGNPESVTFSHDLPLNIGQNIIITRAYDKTAKEGYDERTVYRDPWMPSVCISSPAEGSIYPEGATVPVTIEASDQGYGFKVKLYMDGDFVEEKSGAANELAVESMSANFSLRPISAGSHIIRAEAIDNGGNIVFDTLTITTDPWPPTLSILLPEEGSRYNGSSIIPVKIKASDQGIGFTLEVFLDNESKGQVAGPANISTSQDITFNGSVGPLMGGEHVLMAVVTDTGGNTVTMERIIQVDNWQPTVGIITPQQGDVLGAQSIVPLQVWASDQGYGFSLQVTLNGYPIYQGDGPANDKAPASINFSDQLGPLSQDNQVIKVMAIDSVGNSASTSISIHSDTFPPSVSILSPADGSLYTSSMGIPLEIKASDQGYGFILKVYLDGDLMYEAYGPANSNAVETIRYQSSLGPFEPGDYLITAEAIDFAGNLSSASNTVIVYGDAPAPTPSQTIFDLYARAKDSKLNIVWTKVTGAESYNIYRSLKEGGPYELIAEGHLTDYATYADSGLTNNVTYYYVVTSLTNGVESLHSNEAHATPLPRSR